MPELVKVSERNILGVNSQGNDISSRINILGQEYRVRNDSYSVFIVDSKTVKLSDFSGVSISPININKGRFSLRFNENARLKRVNVTLPLTKDNLVETVLEYWAAGWFVQIGDTIKLEDFVQPPPKKNMSEVLRILGYDSDYDDDDNIIPDGVVDDLRYATGASIAGASGGDGTTPDVPPA